MRSLTVRSALAAMAVAAAALGSAATATAAPAGPCEDVTYVGVCEPLGEQPRSSSQQGMGEVVIPGTGSSSQTGG
jgi:hypothetical protein